MCIHRRLPFVGILAFLVMLSGCGRLSGKESDISYKAASDRIAALAERTLQIGLGDEWRLAEQNARQGLCDDAFGALSDHVRPVLRYQFPLNRLDDDPARFVAKVEELWLANELETSSSVSSRVTRRFGVSSDGFNYQVTVNRESEIVYVGGSGPCVDPPDD